MAIAKLRMGWFTDVMNSDPTAISRSSGPGDLFQLLRDGRLYTRSDLAARTGLARSTVAAKVAQLLDSGLVALAGEASSTGGRPPAPFAFNPAARVVLAVDLGAVHARLAITDLVGNVLVEHGEPMRIGDGPVKILDRVARIGTELLAGSGRSAAELVGIGVGLPGPVEHSTGRPINPPIMPGWDGFDVPGRLQTTFSAPVLVDNDVNIMALGEHNSVWPEVDHLLFVKIATGIGSGIINDGRIARGAQGAAGDIGHIAVLGGSDIPCRCGNFGCLEAVASGAALAQALQTDGLGAGVIELVRSGDVRAIGAVRQAGREIGGVLAACVSVLNPSVIVIGGSMAAAGEHLLAGIREVVYQRSLPLATQHLRIVSSRTEGRAGVIGAAAMAAEYALSATTIDAQISA